MILYVTTLITAMYYGWGWADRRIRPRAVIGFAAVAFFGAASFITIGALRNAQAYTGGSVGDLWRYNIEHPEKNMLSLDVMYQRSVEGMSGLTGAFTQAAVAPQSIRHDYGVEWITQGVMLALPGPVKAQLSGIEDALLPFRWYNQSIIAPGVETSYTSFRLVGVHFLFTGVFCHCLEPLPVCDLPPVFAAAEALWFCADWLRHLLCARHPVRLDRVFDSLHRYHPRFRATLGLVGSAETGFRTAVRDRSA